MQDEGYADYNAYDNHLNHSNDVISNTIQGSLLSSGAEGNIMYTSTTNIGFIAGQYVNILTGCSGGIAYLNHSQLGQYTTSGGDPVMNGIGWFALCDAASWNSVGGCGGSPLPPSASSSAKFAFPIGDGQLYPDFQNWAVNLTSPSGTLVNGTIQYQEGNQWTFVNKIYSDPFTYNMGTDNQATIPVSKANTLFGNCSESNIPGCSQQWIAEMFLNGSTVSSSEIIFNVGVRTSTIALTSSTQNVGPFLYNPFQQTPSYSYVSVASSVASQYASSTGCPTPKDWTDIGGGISYALCGTINLLFVPGPIGMGQVSSTISSLESVPPYSWFFQVNDTVAGAANATTTSSGIVFNDIPAGFNRTTTITVLPADPSTDPNLTRITRYSPDSLLDIMWNLALIGFIILIVIGFYKIVL